MASTSCKPEMITPKDLYGVPLRSGLEPFEATRVEKTALILGVDGGGTKCRARLYSSVGELLGEGTAGPANVRFGIEESFSAISDAARQCLSAAGLSWTERNRIIACLALAGASGPCERTNVKRRPHPYLRAIITTDAHAAWSGPPDRLTPCGASEY